MDPYSILMALAVAVGLLGADAALNANTLGVHINVPAELGSRGVTRQVAEDVFTNEVARIAQTPSLLSPLAVRSTSERTIIGVVAKSLNLDDMTYALQKSIGLNPVRLSGTIMPADTRPRFVLTAASSATGSFMVDINNENGDYVELVRRAAQLTLERVSPYRAALYHFVQAADAKSTDFSVAESIALRDLGEPLRADTVERRAFFYNLLGVVALMRKDTAAAERRFAEAVAQHPTLAVAHLNLAFMAIHRDRYDEAIAIARQVLGPRPMTKSPQLLATAYTTMGVAAWARGHYGDSEAHFAAAVREYWGTTAGYDYWSKMLAEQGRTVEAAAKQRMAVANLPYFENYPEVAMLYFEMSPIDKAPLVRR